MRHKVRRKRLTRIGCRRSRHIKRRKEVVKLQDFIKKVAERYGIKYDEKQEFPAVKLKDGTVKYITKETQRKILNNEPSETITQLKEERE